jgi:crotonobetainyl-CoA:carnitine CoA-transferase CaiB-like acyl-CoA transferase
MQGLEGIRVVEVGQMVAVPWATRLIADLGAEVVKVEPLDGDRSRRRGPFPGKPDISQSGLFTHLNLNKRSVVADLADAAGRSHLRELISSADLLIHDLAPDFADATGLHESELTQDHPSLVTVSVTPFGRSGPYSRWRAEDLQLIHGGGWGWLTPGCSEDAELPPLKPAGQQAGFQIGFAAATIALGALDRALRTGHGEYLDLAGMAYIASMLEGGFISWSYLNEIPGRTGTRILNPWRIFEVKDGRIFIVCVENDQWERLKEVMGTPEWSQMEIFDTQEGRYEAEDLLHMWLGEWAAPQSVMDLFHLGQANRIGFAPVNTIEQMLDDPHLQARDFLVEVDQPGLGKIILPGPPARLSNPWWSIRQPAPELGAHQGVGFDQPRVVPVNSKKVPSRPLDGVTVADFTWVWAGPFCTMHLAHLGAEVIKVESRQAPDLGRRLPIHSVNHEATPNTNGYFNQWGQGKKSVTLDLSTAEGQAIAKQIAVQCDLVVSNYATGVMDRFGLGYDDLAAERPDVIVGAISGYGHYGPYRHYLGYGPTTAPLSGLSSMTGHEGGKPEEVGVSLGDPAAGIATAYLLMAALIARRRTGEGQLIDTSLWEATASSAVEGWMQHVLTGNQPDLCGNRDPIMAPHNLYRCQGEDNWVAISCSSDQEWQAMASLLGINDSRFLTAASRKEFENQLDAQIETWTSTRDQWDVTRLLQDVGIPAMPSLDARALDQDPHLNARGFIERLNHQEVGALAHTGVPWLLHDGPNGVRTPAPMLGQHTEEILSSLLGLSDSEIIHLRDHNILS